MNVEQLTKILDESKDEFVKAVKAKLIEKLTADISYDLPSLLKKDVETFYVEEIRPMVKQYLSDNKSALMQNVIKACVDASDAVALTMAEHIKKTMHNDYSARKVFEALFGR